MRRKNAASVKVMAPSRGLVTRFASNIADAFHPTTPTANGDKQRVCTVAQNMRFEDGVMANAPGVQRVTLANALLTGLVAHWRMDEASGVRNDAVGVLNLRDNTANTLGVAGHIGLAAAIVDGSQGDASGFALGGDPIVSVSGGFTITGWVNFAQLTGTDQIMAAGLEASLGFVLSRVGSAIQFVVNGGSSSGSITSGVTLSANTWYFIAARLDTSGNFLSIQVNNNAPTAGAGGSYTGGFGVAPFYILGFGGPEALPFLVDSFSLWSRTLLDAEVTALYNAGTGLDYPFLGGPFNLVYQGNITGATPTPTFLGNDSSLYTGNKGANYVLTLTQILTGAATSPGYRWAATDFIDKVVLAKNSAAPQYWNVSTGAGTLPVPGLATGTTFDGVESFFGHLLFWSGNTLTWSDLNDITNYIPVGATSDTLVLTANGAFTQPAVNTPLTVTVNTISGVAVNGGFYRIDDGIGATATTSFYKLTPINSTSVSLTLLDKTGRKVLGGTFADKTPIVPLTANEAGSAVIFGSDANGPIFQVVASGDNAYVFKERSIQSLQYVGLGSGIFYIRTAVTNEGLLARYGLLNLGMGRIIFLGQRELYDYRGDSNPAPICQQYTRQLFAELDRNHLEELVMMHRELRNEIWLVYPALGGVLKVLVWNYLEDTASLDIYDPSMAGFTAARMMDWQTDPAWLSLSDTDTWTNYSSAIRWEDLGGAGKERVAVLASGDGNLLIHGNVYNRLGAGYPCIAETMDYDFDDDAAFKYVDAVNLALQVRSPDNTPRSLSVQVGYRSTLDADITYTPAVLIQVQGNANFTAKVNPGGAGRYIRLRFQSTDADVQFRISGYEIFARMGGTY